MVTLPSRVRPFSREEYDRIVALGVIGPDERVELLNGAIVNKMAQRPPHASSTSKLTRLLMREYGEGHAVRSQSPIALTGESEPEPDILVAREPDDAYDRRHPAPEDTLLIVEVADIPFAEDRRDKIFMYLAAGVPEVWLLDLPNRRLLRFVLASDPIVPEILAEDALLPVGEGATVRDLLP